MALTSLLADIIERRCADGARVISEYQPSLRGRWPVDPRPKGERPMQQSPTKEEWMRAWGIILQVVQKHEQRYQLRLAEEMTFFFKFNADRTELSDGKYLTKGEASQLTGAPWGQILDLEQMFGGVLVWGSYLFIAEAKVMDAFRRYGSDLTLSHMINDIAEERTAA
jgi:hypothetical protein